MVLNPKLAKPCPFAKERSNMVQSLLRICASVNIPADHSNGTQNIQPAKLGVTEMQHNQHNFIKSWEMGNTKGRVCM